MAKKLKADFENVEVSVNSKTLGRIKVNTSDEDVMKWAEIPAFAFMFEGKIPTDSPHPENVLTFCIHSPVALPIIVSPIIESVNIVSSISFKSDRS